MAYGGAGIGRLDGLVYFIKGTAPGERVLVREVQRKKNFGIATLVEILRNSHSRITPRCPLALLHSHGDPRFACPGCSYQHIDYEQEIGIKNGQLKSFLEKAQGGKSDFFIRHPLKSQSPFNYRNKLVLHSGNGNFGYFAEDNKTVINVEKCHIANSRINECLSKFTEVNSKIMQEGETILFRHTEKNGTICLKEKEKGELSTLSENTLAGEFRVPARGFFQVNPCSLNHAIKEFSQILTALMPDFLLDLYCGCGVFSILAGKLGIPNVYGSDVETGTIRAAIRNSESHDVAEKCKFHFSSAELFMRRNFGKIPDSNTAIFLDPPRSGISKEATNLILKKRCKWIIYMSCTADTLARDIKLLSQSYAIKSAVMIDMFPRTYHFESIVLLEKY